MDKWHNIKRVIALFFLIGITLNGYGQVKKWGEIKSNILEQEMYGPDSSVSAVVLFDKGDLRVEDDLQYYMERHVRIKIFKRDGFKWGTVNIDYNKGYDQEIEDLEAVTYNLSEDGRIQKTRVDKDAFFNKEIIDDWNQITFTFPRLEPGSIIEYRYTYKIGEPNNIPAWYFDRTIPVKWNELTAEFPSFLKFTKLFKGNEDLHINEVEEFNKSIRINYKKETDSYATTETGVRRISFNGDSFKWVMKDREGIPHLPYMTTPDDYRAQIQFQLTEFNIPDVYQKDYAKSWSKVISHLLDEEFGSFLDGQGEFRGILESLPLQEKNETEKIRVIVDHLAKSYRWDQTHGLYGEYSLKELLSSQMGSAVELNLLLTGILREAKYNVFPVLISTKDNGKVSVNHVLPNQFNHLIVLVKLSNHDLLLDISGDNRSLYLLPEKDLNGSGLVLKSTAEANENWVKLIPLTNTSKTVLFSAKVSKSGLMNGMVNGVSSGYYAKEYRNYIQERGEEDFFNGKLMAEFKGFDLDGLHIGNPAEPDSILRFKGEMKNGKSMGTQLSGETIYLESVPIMKWKENPLKNKERKYPVEFKSAFSEQLLFSYQIPPGFEVVDYPGKIVSRIPDKGGMFVRFVSVNESKITVRSVIELERPRFSADEYQRLKQFFSQIVEAHAEKIVLKKTGKLD